MGKYIIDGTIMLGGGEKLFGDPDSGQIVYLPDGKLTDEEVARMVRDGFLRTPAEALSAEALQAHLDDLQGRLAAAEAAVTDKSGESSPESAPAAE